MTPFLSDDQINQFDSDLSFDERSYKGTKISRRTTDGFVNATAMCKANGKVWSKYRESDRCQLYLDALEGSSGIRMFDLIEARQGYGGGTWVHPQVAIDLARWISAPFAVWMDGWFLEAVSEQTTVATEPVAALPEGMRSLEWFMGFTHRWNIKLDRRDMLHIKEAAQALALPPAGGSQSIYNDYPVSRLVLDIFGKRLNLEKLKTIGSRLSKMWRAEKGEKPMKHDQYVDGACRSVNSYPRDWAEPALKRLEDTEPDLFMM